MSLVHRVGRLAVASAAAFVLGCSSDARTSSGQSGGGTNGGPTTADAPLPKTADSGFRPATDGFAFPNYADAPGPGVFDAAALQRMFGDGVCSSTTNGTCALTPQGQDWADKVNTSLQGGHCEGFAVLSLLLFNKWLDPAPFGADTTSALTLDGNGALNHELAYWYATQFLEDPVITSTHAFKAADAVDYLLGTFANPSKDTIARIGLARVDASGAVVGGHAVTPYAVLEGDTPGTKKIMVYDSNHPGEEHAIVVDVGANSWSYVAGTDPQEPDSLYSGDLTNKNRLYVAAVHPRLGVHPCPFCTSGGSAQGLRPMAPIWPVTPVAQHRSLLVHGNLDPVATDSSGHRVGRVAGQIVNEVPGAIVTPGFSGGLWADNAPVQILLPLGGDFEVSVTPRAASDSGSKSSVTLFGNGYSLGIDYPAGSAVMGDTIGMPENAKGVTLTSVGPSSATLAMAVQTAGGGVTAHIAINNLPAGANVGLQTEGATGKVGVAVDSPTPVDVKLNVGIDKGDGTGKQVFEGGVQSSGKDSVGVDLGSWTGGTDPMPISVAPSDGSPPKVVVVDNSHDYTPPAVDECALGLSNCSINAICTDTPASFTCACKAGYGGDGVSCIKGAPNPVAAPPAAPAIAYHFPGAPALLATVGKLLMIAPPVNTGGLITTYSVAPALPAGLTFDSSTGAILGTPTAVSEATTYTVTAANGGGTASATLVVTVQAATPKISYAAGNHALFRWDPAPVLSPTNAGGPALEYAITPALPAGLSFDASTGQISGTPTALSPVTSYTVTASNLSGSWPTALSISVVCAGGAACETPSGVVISGTVSGLVGSGLVLQDNGTDDLAITANGSFQFKSSLAPNGPYAVTVLTSPTLPAQTCTVSNGSGSVPLVDVTNVAITCTTSSFSVGGTITGLLGTAILQDNGGNNLALSSAGAFTFSSPVPSGGSYAVTVLSQPTSPTQICSVTAGNGTIANGNVTSVGIVCSTTSFTVGANVIGLAGSGLVLQDNGGDNLPVSPGTTSVTFASRVPSGSAYGITVLQQPVGQTCSVSGGTGTIGTGNVATAVINCSADTFTVSGTVSGLAGTLVLENDAGDDLTLNSSGSFAFHTPIAYGATYAVTVLNQPSAPSQTCVVSNASGTMASANVTNVVVSCTTNPYAIGGNVTGLLGTLVLQDNAGDDLAVSSDGAFTFATPVLSGHGWNVTVRTQPSSPTQTCVVTSNASGVVGSSNVTLVGVTCTTSRYAVGGNVSGLSGTVVLQDNGADNLSVSANGAFTFATSLASAQTYAVTVASPPAGQTCAVTSGSGTVVNGAVSDVSVVCTSTNPSSNSCKSLLASNPGLASGTYTLTGSTPYQTYCDMTTDGGGWTLVMKLAAGDFCNDSPNWTSSTPFNESFMMDASLPGVGNYDSKSSAFYLVQDATSIRFDTTRGSVTTTFVAPSSARTLMTTNDIAFAAYPDRNAWKNAFLQDRDTAPIFMRAGVVVPDPTGCRTNPAATPTGCGQTCMFCYQASNGSGCGESTADDVNSGVGNGEAYCGGGRSNCSTGGSWSDPNEQALVWVR